MKLEALEFNIAEMHSVTSGVADIIACSEDKRLQFQVITYTEKPITLSNHIIDAIGSGDMPRAHTLASLFLSIYYLNKDKIDDFLYKKHEARKL